MPRLNSRSIEILVFSALILLAAFLRLYALDRLPPGLHYDEAFNGILARQVITGPDRPIFFTENLTEEPMMGYATALAFLVFGDTAWHIRLVAAIAGIVTVAALYFLAREMFQSRWLAALATFVLAILYWHVNFSRLGMEPILTPLTMTLTFVFLWRALFPPPPGGGGLGWGAWALAGFFLASTQYTYKAALFFPGVVAAFLGSEILSDRIFLRQNWRGLVIFAAVAVLFFAPLGLYFGAHPEQFLERPSTVASAGAATIVDNAIKVAGMFFVRGDENPRSNLPGRPALDPFLALGFIVGLVACLARIRRREARLLLLWLGVMALPSIVTDFAPHFGRDIGLPPVIALIVACGFGTLVQTGHTINQSIDRRLLTADRLRFTVYGLLFTGFAFSAYSTVNDYFNVWGARTGLFDSFDVGLLTLAQKLRERPGNETLYLAPVERAYYTMQYGLAQRSARSFDGRSVLVVPPPGTLAAYGIVTREDKQSLARLEKIFPNGRVVDAINDWKDKPYAAIFRSDGAANSAPQQAVNARLGDAIELIGYDLAREGSRIAVTIYWRSRVETPIDYTVFVHLLGATPAVVLAQDDARPGRGSYPTPRWRAGEIIIDEYHLNIPRDAPAGDYQIEIGMYQLETGARARVIDARGAPMENDRVVFKGITLP